MNEMFKKVNARERLIGWYHSGPKLRASDLKINELFKRYTPNPLLVIIDVQPKEAGVPTDAYFAVDEIKDVRWLAVARQPRSLCADETNYRTAQQHPRLLSTQHPSSRPRRRKKSELSTYFVTSVTWQLAHYLRALPINSSPSKVFTCGCRTFRCT
jgi:proteasome lid subunit RPN8/RPN11